MTKCSECLHEDMCKFKDKMQSAVDTIMSSNPIANLDNDEFEKNYFEFELEFAFKCKKFISNSFTRPRS